MYVKKGVENTRELCNKYKLGCIEEREIMQKTSDKTIYGNIKEKKWKILTILTTPYTLAKKAKLGLSSKITYSLA